jgi:Protein of unknown function (DUF2800)
MSDPAAHAKLSPSSATGWFNCAAYPDVNAQHINEDNEAAAEGTAAHAISDFCLTHGFDAHDMIGTVTNITGKRRKTVRQSDGKLVKTDEVEPVTFTFEWTEDDADLLQPGLDWIREQEGDFYGEARVDLSEWLGDNQFGTMDRVIVSNTQMVVSDLKWGRGIPVQAVGSKQLRLYALGAWKKYADYIDDPDFPLLIHIDQPRNAAGGGLWKITLGELWAFGEEARAAAARTRLPNPSRTATQDGCLWCLGKETCVEFHEYNLQMLGLDDFEDLDDLDDLQLADPDRLTPERLRVIHEHTPTIKKWLDGVHSTLFRQVMSNGVTAGLKLVDGKKSPNKWKDAKAAEKALSGLIGEKCFTKKLITPTQAGKAISVEDWKPVFNKHVIVGQRKPTLVDVADDRPAIESYADASDFDELD